MAEKEGNFTLQAVVGLNIDDRGKWRAVGFVHAPGENDALEMAWIEERLDSREEAVLAGIESARAIAQSLDPDDSIARRKALARTRDHVESGRSSSA